MKRISCQFRNYEKSDVFSNKEPVIMQFSLNKMKIDVNIDGMDDLTTA